jgi:hypothetical protein
MDLEELQAAVGGWIEYVHITGKDRQLGILVVNEEGAVFKQPINPVASALAGQPIFGDVVFLFGEAAKQENL